jgi:hypothetical protein
MPLRCARAHARYVSSSFSQSVSHARCAGSAMPPTGDAGIMQTSGCADDEADDDDDDDDDDDGWLMGSG